MGVKEDTSETVELLKDKICEIQSTKAGFKIYLRKIRAIHPIQGKACMHKPVLLTMRNNHEKTKIMRRKEMKKFGFRLIDDVTKLNTKLINRVIMHKDISSA